MHALVIKILDLLTICLCRNRAREHRETRRLGSKAIFAAIEVCKRKSPLCVSLALAARRVGASQQTNGYIRDETALEGR